MASLPPGGLFQRLLCPWGSLNLEGLYRFLRASDKAPGSQRPLPGARGHCPEGRGGSPSLRVGTKAPPGFPAQKGRPAASQGWPRRAGWRNGLPWGQLFQGTPQGVLSSGQGQRQKRRPLLARWE